MRTLTETAAAKAAPLPDAFLVERIAALSDKGALVELDARHGLSLYAIAYGMLFDPTAADAVVAEVFRDVWRWAGMFDARGNTVRAWLAELTRNAVRTLSGRAESRNGT